MSQTVTPASQPLVQIDYSLIGVNSSLAIKCGLAEADWYQCPVPRETMRKLLERKDGPAIRDTLLWFALLLATGAATIELWHTRWAVLPYACYSVLYATVSDSRWHEAGHGTAFRTDWVNNVLYEIASFMIVRESTVWRWSHMRHHSDTINVGRDPEIAVPRPPDVKALIVNFFCLRVYPKYFERLVLHCMGRIAAEERTFIPESEFPKIYRTARIILIRRRSNSTSAGRP
jgi:Na+-transporting NADH:ubiquinone oxidoreductase subunit F